MYVKPLTKAQQFAEIVGNVWVAVKIALIICAPLLLLATVMHQ